MERAYSACSLPVVDFDPVRIRLLLGNRHQNYRHDLVGHVEQLEKPVNGYLAIEILRAAIRGGFFYWYVTFQNFRYHLRDIYLSNNKPLAFNYFVF